MFAAYRFNSEFNQRMMNISRCIESGIKRYGRDAAIRQLMRQNKYNYATALRVITLDKQLFVSENVL